MELRYCEKCGDIIKLEGKDERINPAEHFVCPRCDGGTEGALASKDSFEGILDQATLNLFSPSTLAMKRKEIAQEPGKPAEASGEASKAPTVQLGSSSPARTARKLQFRCLHCRSTLMIRPVEKASRMVCPKCKGNLYIDQTGIVSRSPPGAGASGAPAPRPGSARLPAAAPAAKVEPVAVPPRAVPSAPAASRPAPMPGSPPPRARGTTGSTMVSKEPRPDSVRRMPSSIQRTFPQGSGAAPALTEAGRTPAPKVGEDPFAGAAADSASLLAAAPRPAKSAAAPRKAPSGSGEPGRARQEDLFRGLSIAGKGSRHGEAAARTHAGAPGSGGSFKDFEELEAELAQVEDFTKPLPEGSTSTEKIHIRSRYHEALPEPVGFLRRVGAFVLVLLLASLAAAPLYLAGHLSAAGGSPNGNPLASGAQRPAFDRLGKVVERGREAVISIPATRRARDGKASAGSPHDRPVHEGDASDRPSPPSSEPLR